LRQSGGIANKKVDEIIRFLKLSSASASVFDSVSSEVSHLLPDVQIEHIGASAIPGAVSKGDLDICVLVAPQAHAQAVQVLEAASYAIKADTLRTPALCMLLSPRADMDVALQVVAKGSEFEFFLHFRDALRADPALVEQYNQLKTRFATSGEERYRAEKSRFITAVLTAHAR
jgi:GrpB-like predicted nucleotidyltransferase (UPF0157 family)